MSHKFKYQDYSLIILFFSLLAILLIFPFFGKLDLSNIILNVFISLILIAAVTSTTHKRRSMLIAITLAALTFITSWGELADRSIAWISISLLFNIIFFSYVIWVHLYEIMTTNMVTKNLLFGAVCIYILIGLLMSFVYILIDIYYPGSFSAQLENFGNLNYSISHHFLSYVYFSFITLTTLGFGDITPISLPARSFAYMEAIAGQFYLTVLVARLIAVYVRSGKIKE